MIWLEFDDESDHDILIVSDDKLEKREEVDSVSDLEDLCGGWSESHVYSEIGARFVILGAFLVTKMTEPYTTIFTKALLEANMIGLGGIGLGKTISMMR